MLKFVRKCAHIDESVVLATENILASATMLNSNDLLMGDVLDIIHSLPFVESLLHPEFFNHPTLPFRLLRRTLGIQMVNPVS